jgi:hypothetical protein
MSTSLSFVKGQGGLGRPLAGTDYISGLLFYSGATLPTGFTSNDRIKVVYSVEEAVALGITNTSLGETKSTATDLCTTKFTTGDTYKLTCATINSTNPISTTATAGTITLCNFTADATAATSTTTSATAIAAAINALTYIHGFTASSNTATVTITAPAGQGLFLNSGTPYVKTVTGAYASTLTQNVVTGVASDIDIMYYHISEFFRMQPKGKLYVGIYATAGVGTFTEITTMQNFAEGEIKQIGVYYKSTGFTTAHVTTLQSVYATNYTANRPLQILVQGDFQGTTLASLTNLHLLTAPNVTVCLAQDGAAAGYKLWKATAKTIGSLGVTLGAVALAKVNESISWIAKFNADNGTEMDYLAFANGDTWKATSTGQITSLDAYGYVFLKKEIDLVGSFFNDSHTSVSGTSDFCNVESNRTMDKSIRSMRFYLLPALGSPVFFNADGTITEGSIGYFETLAQTGLDDMVNAGELSASKASIDPTQKVLSTGTLTIVVQEIPTGVARAIVVNTGYTTSITN